MNVISDALKLVMRPEQGAPVVLFPHGVIVNKEYSQNTISPTVVLPNLTEKPPSWQGVCHHTGSVIVNTLPLEIAKLALDIFVSGGKTNAALDAVLKFLRVIGYGDQYTTDFGFIDKHLNPVVPVAGDEYTGIFMRDRDNLTPIWKENGIIYVVPAGAKDQGPRVMDPGKLLETYKNVDGSDIDLDSIPEGRPEGV